VSGAAAPAATSYERTFPGRADQIGPVRRDIASRLAGHPASDDAVLIASELATNSVLHSASAGECFTVRCQAHCGYVQIEVEDLGGPWQPGQPDGRPHGLDVIGALTGPDGWETDTTDEGNRIVRARLDRLLQLAEFSLELGQDVQAHGYGGVVRAVDGLVEDQDAFVQCLRVGEAPFGSQVGGGPVQQPADVLEHRRAGLPAGVTGGGQDMGKQDFPPGPGPGRVEGLDGRVDAQQQQRQGQRVRPSASADGGLDQVVQLEAGRGPPARA